MTVSKSHVSDTFAADRVAARSSLSVVLRRAAPQTILAYHELSSDHTNYRYALSCRQFENHLQLVAQLQEHSDDHKSPLALSFDDGHISNYTHALPLLEKYNRKAIFFVIAGRIGKHKEFMNWKQLREIVSLGHQVESHSWSHKFLTDCSGSGLREELARSRETLEQQLGVAVQALSAPHGRWDRRVLRACADAGYRRLYTSDPWSPSRTLEQVDLVGRLIMVQSMDASRLTNWLAMGRTQAALYRTEYALKRSAQRLLGSKIYYRLWTRFSGWAGPDDTSLHGRT